jgi:hypothetical protein
MITRRAPTTRPATPRSCGRSACRRRAQSTSSTRRTVVAPPPNSALPHACPRPPNRYVARRRARYAAGGGGGGFGGLGGAGFGGRGGSMGQPILGGFDLAGRGQRLLSRRIRRTIGSSASVIQGVNPRERGGIIEDGGRPCPRGNRRTHRQILAAAK